MHHAADAREQLLARAARQPEPVERDVAGDRAHAAARLRRRVEQALEDSIQARVRGGLRGRADQADQLILVALEQPREQLHAKEAGRPGEQHRLAHRSGAPIA